MNPIDADTVFTDLQKIRESSPLIHNITNYVVMEQTANSLLAVGASPIMAHAVEEVEEIVKIANALVLNLGTLSSSWIKSMELALKSAALKGIPVVLDPVGAGSTSFRTETALDLLTQGGVTAVRGNASEIASLAEEKSTTKGVDSLLVALEHSEAAKKIAAKNVCTVWMSGKSDVITDGKTLAKVHNGHFLMTKVTGMGCIATALLAAFLSVNSNSFKAAVHTAVLMGIVGEMAADQSAGPGSFKSNFLDTLYLISAADIEKRIQCEIL